ncbi:unnamed protein product [Rangifer tarandus platyrhynchus]|uniref:Uncharacterized protein n=2 Tax=Rangifer tarandus platyrhynchus TaxID=3082113 RepID=A0ACB0F9Y6_RANTA|nr:unnamed protein product [Rangifer tarandus platyrhynchus]CAI9709913.1 unnamed protein product [Rangifer tarandus platyrhynchus]
MDTPAEDVPNFGLEPARLCSPEPPAPANVRAEVDGVDSAGIRAEGMHWRPPNAAREAGPARPQGAGARRRRRCQGCVQVGRGTAGCRGPSGGGTESERGGNPLPGAVRAPGGGRAAPTCGVRAASGTCAVAADSRGSGAAGTAGGRGAGKEAGPERGPRRRPELRAGIRVGPAGVGRGGARPGASPRRLNAPAGEEVSGL